MGNVRNELIRGETGWSTFEEREAKAKWMLRVVFDREGWKKYICERIQECVRRAWKDGFNGIDRGVVLCLCEVRIWIICVDGWSMYLCIVLRCIQCSILLHLWTSAS